MDLESDPTVFVPYSVRLNGREVRTPALLVVIDQRGVNIGPGRIPTLALADVESGRIEIRPVPADWRRVASRWRRVSSSITRHTTRSKRSRTSASFSTDPHKNAIRKRDSSKSSAASDLRKPWRDAICLPSPAPADPGPPLASRPLPSQLDLPGTGPAHCRRSSTNTTAQTTVDVRLLGGGRVPPPGIDSGEGDETPPANRVAAHADDLVGSHPSAWHHRAGGDPTALWTAVTCTTPPMTT
ncbi:hypothetical protein Prum_092250 [Phytohabitans rumicis]|uniref:Uncharacterized protein n=1 Tax=Phytohabitans rumicis TaxID=1076125 RepID=A0A6V8LED0_9ACTN|nr:hypothetical protein Prum_092250 [Phytohabitans rumicis]